MNPDIEDHLNRAKELLDLSEEILRSGHPADSISRSYYGVFHAMKAVLLDLNLVRSSHHAVLAAFGENLVATGRIDQRFHVIARNIFAARNQSDYLAKPTDTIEDAEDFLNGAREFVAECRRYLTGMDLET